MSVSKGDRAPRCLSLISESRVMTLGTGGGKAPWTAPVYYIYRSRGFYFFSSPESRHIREGIDAHCSASVFRDADDPGQLQGIQMTGRITACTGSMAEIKTALAYARRFAIMVDKKDVMEFFLNRFHARLYCFSPGQIFFMDNQAAFGSRERVEL